MNYEKALHRDRVQIAVALNGRGHPLARFGLIQTDADDLFPVVHPRLRQFCRDVERKLPPDEKIHRLPTAFLR
jgi:hypothetical protein